MRDVFFLDLSLNKVVSNTNMLYYILQTLTGEATSGMSTLLYFLPEMALIGAIHFYIMSVNRRTMAALRESSNYYHENSEDEADEEEQIEPTPETKENIEPVTPNGSDSSAPVGTPNAETVETRHDSET